MALPNFTPNVNGYNPMGQMNNPYGVNYGAFQQQMAQMTPQVTNPQIQSQDLIMVNGINGAQNYQVKPNSRVVLFDANEDVFYIKQTDAGGYPTIQAYQFIAKTDMTAGATEYVTRAEYNALVNEVNRLKEVNTHAVEPVSETADKPAK